MPVGQTPEAVRATAAFRQVETRRQAAAAETARLTRAGFRQAETRRRAGEVAAERLALAQRQFAFQESGRRLEQELQQQTLQRQQTRQQLFTQLSEFPAGTFTTGPIAPGAAAGPGGVPVLGGQAFPELAGLAGLGGPRGALGPFGTQITAGAAGDVLPLIGQLIGAGADPRQVTEFLRILGQAQAGAAAPGPGGPEPGPAVSGFARGDLPPTAPQPPALVPPIAGPPIAPPAPPEQGIIDRFLQAQSERGIGPAILQELGLAAGEVPGITEAAIETVAPPVLGFFGGSQRIEALVGRQEAERQADIAEARAEREIVQQLLKGPDRDVASTILEITRPTAVEELLPGARVAAALDVPLTRGEPGARRGLLERAAFEGALARALEILREIDDPERRERIITALDRVRPGFGQRLAEELAGVPGL